VKVAWVDYDRKVIPRRLLSPGECYFEMSFSSHPWVVHAVDS
ncbi:unnamed protein product, partial [Discosporangium mesarthrocarpum]